MRLPRTQPNCWHLCVRCNNNIPGNDDVMNFLINIIIIIIINYYYCIYYYYIIIQPYKYLTNSTKRHYAVFVLQRSKAHPDAKNR